MEKEQNQRGAGRQSSDDRQSGSNNNTGKHYFLGIGISNYKYMPLLPNAVKDVEDIAELLRSEYKFEEKNIFELYEEAAIIDNIIMKFDYLKGRINQQDSLVIYFAGHGGYDNMNGYWAAYDFETNAPHSGSFNETSIIDQIALLQCQKILIIEDRCYAATMPDAQAKWRQPIKPDGRPIYVLSSVDKNTQAHDGRPGENSPFAQAIKQILLENKDDILSFDKGLISKHYNEGYFKFVNLYSGSDVSPFTFHKKKRHLQFYNEGEIWKVLFESKENHPVTLLKQFNKAFPNSKRKSNSIERQKKGETAVRKDWEGLLGKTVDSFVDFIKTFRYFESKEIKKAYNIIYGFLDKYPEVRGKIENGNDVNTFVERRSVVDIESKAQYLTVLLEKVTFNEESLFKCDSIEFGIKPVSVEMFQKFSLTEQLIDYKQKLQEKMGYAPLDSHPAIYVSWIEAIQFANWLSIENNFSPVYIMVDFYLIGIDNDSEGFRLPTEAEWMFTGHKGDIENIDWKNPDEIPWYEDNSEGKVQEIGLKKPDNNGIYDLLGNMYEWCWDLYDIDEEGRGFVCKGGSYQSAKEKLSISESSIFYDSELQVGFRLVRSIHLPPTPLKSTVT